MRARPLVVLGILGAGLPLSVRAQAADGTAGAPSAAAPAAPAAPRPPPAAHTRPDPFFPPGFDDVDPTTAPVGSGGDDGEESHSLFGEEIKTEISLWAGVTNSKPDGYVVGAYAVMEGKWIGFDAAFEGVGMENITGPIRSEDSGNPIGWGSAHVTWSIIDRPGLHVRILTGGSMLALPRSKFTETQAWTGKTLYGPDGGINGYLRLLGPFGAEGWARVTPFPVRVEDFYGGFSLRNGPIGVSAGWRKLKISGDGVEAPALSFDGPQAGIGVRF